MSEAAEKPDMAFIAWAKQRMREINSEAAELTSELGLPPEAKYAVMELTRRAEQKVIARPDTQGLVTSFATWVIESLFPRRPSLAMGTLGGYGEAGSSEQIQEYENNEAGLKLTARRIERSGELSANLEVRISRTDGSPVEGITVSLYVTLGNPQQKKTNGEGKVWFSGLSNADVKSWKLEITS